MFYEDFRPFKFLLERVTHSYFLHKIHEPTLIFVGLLSTYVFFTKKVFPPLLSFFLQIPFLQIINNAKVVKDIVVFGRWQSLIRAPKGLFSWSIRPVHEHRKERIVN